MEKASVKVFRAAMVFLLTVAVISFGNVGYAAQKSKDVTIKISSKKSLVNMQSIDSTSLTDDGIKAAKLVMDYLTTKNIESARQALAIYDKIIPKENYGGDYTALQWILEYMLAPEAEKPKFMTDKTFESYYSFFADNDFSQLKEYLNRKYKLAEIKDIDPAEGMKRRAFLEDFILFNNPKRELWEKSSAMIKALKLKPGMKIADIGSGPGYFTYKFSRLVGDKGKVFAIDNVQEHLDYIKGFTSKNAMNNVQTVLTTDHTIGMANEKVDVAWICSLYHIIYVAYKEEAKDQFVESIKKVLKKGGILYVADNGLVPDGVLPYHAPYIDKNLIIGQMQQYGFKYLKEYQFIPQRYILKFQKI
jgi:ubiquinone/menaquinone biosynthesis C-methylase UbiE